MMKKNGFTLMEILVTVAIASIVVTVGVPLYNGSMENTRRMEAETMLYSIHLGEKGYFTRNRVYWNGGANAIILVPPDPTNPFDVNGNLSIDLPVPAFYTLPDFSNIAGYTAVTRRTTNLNSKVCINQTGTLAYDAACP